MKFIVKIPKCFKYTTWYKTEIRDDGYSQVYLDFVKENNIQNLTVKEQELLKLLVDNNYGRLDELVNNYKNGIKRR